MTTSAEVIEKWRLQAAEWLDLQEAADILRECKNDVFAEITHKQEGASNAEKERNARRSPEWTGHRTKMVEAESKARRAKLRLKYQNMMFQAWVSESANARAEMGKHR